MRGLIQRVTSASVVVEGESVASIGQGLCVLVGVSVDDTPKDADWLARKVANIRLFEDGERRWDRSVKDVGLEVLAVSQFTLQSVLKGNKPDFHKAMGPEKGRELYEAFLDRLRELHGPDKVQQGRFGAYMDVRIANDGPVTISLDSQKPS